MNWVIFSRLVIVASIVWEIITFVNASRGKLGYKFLFDIQEFLVMSAPVVIIIGIMWAFGIFRLKAEKIKKDEE